MSILSDGLRSASLELIQKSSRLAKIDVLHIIKQKMGNNPVEKEADDNIYSECKVRNADPLIIGTFGEPNERGLGSTRDIDFANYTVKMAVALRDIPLIRTNGVFSNSTGELEKFLNIWNKYSGSRVDHQRIHSTDKVVNPLSIISSGINRGEKNIHFEMLIANCKLRDTLANESKYFGDIILYAYDRLGYGSQFTDLNKYTENAEYRTTISALTGKHEYGHKLLKAVEQSIDDLNFIKTEIEIFGIKSYITKCMLWVSNYIAPANRQTQIHK